jgi:hypothetical protein
MCGLAAIALLSGQRRAQAEPADPPPPPMSWEAAMACELVVVATYEAHGESSLRLHVRRVLKGSLPTLDATIDVGVEMPFAVVTTPPGDIEQRRARGGDEKGPWLCTMSKLRGGAPWRPTALMTTSTASAIYFLPKASSPVLREAGQVQRPSLADGWATSLSGGKADVLWRLTQPTDPVLGNQALEEVASSRDARALETLVADVVTPPEDVGWPLSRGWSLAATTLREVGDVQGDVYDRALARLDDPVTKGGHDDLAAICALADPARAAKDLIARTAADRPFPIRQAAIRALGDVGTGEVLEALLRFVEGSDPFAADSAAEGLKTLLRAEYHYDVRRRTADVARLRAQAWPRLAALPTTQRTSNIVHDLRESFVETAPPTIDDVKAALAAPPGGYADSPPWKTAKAMAAAPSAAFVPLLVEALQRVPADRYVELGRFAWREALERHARLCRRAMTAACDRAGLLRLLDGGRDGRWWARLSSLLGRDPTPDAERIAGEIGYGNLPRADSLQLVLEDDPAHGRALLDRALELGLRDGFSARLTRYSRDQWCSLLALAVRHGRNDLVGPLVEAVTAAAQSSESGLGTWKTLLDARNADATAAYVRVLDDAIAALARRPTGFSRHGIEWMLASLWTASPSEMLRRLPPLLRSPDPSLRELGGLALARSLEWSPTTHGWWRLTAAVRAPALAAAERMIEKVAAARDVVEARVLFLRASGVPLEGTRGPSWVPALEASCRDRDPTVAANALRVLEAVAGDDDIVQEIESLRAPDRPRAIHVWLLDRGLVPK